MARILDISEFILLKKLRSELESTKKDVKLLGDEFDSIIRTLNDTNKAMQKQAATQSNTSKNVKASAKGTEKLSAAEKELQRIRKASEKINVETARAQLELTQKRREARKEAEKQLGVTKKQIPFTQRMTGAFRTAALQITAVFVAVQGAIKGITAYVKLNSEVNKQTSQTAALFNMEAREARELTTEIRKLATSFDQEFSDVLRSANVIAKEFGISGEEAVNLINEGFQKGANINGEFLEQLKEYPAQLKTVGLNAEETIAIITQTEREGVFSDKGIDAIKEAGIRLRELTPATRSALDQIGLSSKEIERSLADGSKTLFQVTQEVSAQLATLPPQSAEVGTAIADIFGGPGEDAGLRFLTTLKDINTDLGTIESTLSEDEQASIRLKSVWEELRTSSVGQGGFITGVKNGLADLLLSVLQLKDDFIGTWNELIAKSEIFRTAIAILTNTVKVNFKLMRESVQLLLDPIKLVARLIKASLTGNFKEMKNIVKESMNSAKNRFIDVKDAAIDAGISIKQAFTGENADQFAIKIDGVTNKVKSFNQEYKNLNKTVIKAGREQIDLNLKEIKTIEEVTGEKLTSAEQYYKERAKLEERLTKKTEEEEEKRRLTTEETFGAIQDLANGTFDFLTSLREREMQEIAEREAYELSLVGDNEEAQQAIREKFDRQRAKLQRKQAISDKAQALFNAGMNTAQAITAALTIPPPAGPILAVLNGILGGIQIAAIAAKPIPQFAEGTGPGGLPASMWAEFGEAGAELVKEPGKSPYIADGPTISYLPKGTEILPNYETERFLAAHGGISEAKFNEFVKEQRATRIALENQTHHHASLTERGLQYQTRKGNTTINWINKYMHRS